MFCPYCGEKQKNNGSSVCHNCQSDLGFVYLDTNHVRLEEKACAENASNAVASDDSTQPEQAICQQDSANDIKQPIEVLNASREQAPVASDVNKQAATESSTQIKYLKRSFYNLVAASVLIMVTLLHGIFGISHIYTTGFGIGTVFEHTHLFHLGYAFAMRVDAYFFAALGVANAVLSIYFKKKAVTDFAAYQHKAECIVFALAVTAFAIPILMSIFPVIEL